MAVSIFSTMDPRLSEIAETLAEDAASGASEMHASILNSLLAISDADLSAIPTSEWEDFSVAIHRAKPSIAPVFNIANMIMLMMERGTKDGGSLRHVLMEVLERERKSGTRISEHAARLIKGRWFMDKPFLSG